MVSNKEFFFIILTLIERLILFLFLLSHSPSLSTYILIYIFFLNEGVMMLAKPRFNSIATLIAEK